MDIGRIISAIDSVWITERDRIMAAPMDETVRAVVVSEVHGAIRNVQNILSLHWEEEMRAGLAKGTTNAISG
jgi:hypothetical protein